MTATEQLLSLLACQRDVLQRLQGLMHEERTCLLNNRIDYLERVIQEQTMLMAEQALLSSHIESALSRLGAELGLDGRISLAHICAHLAEPIQEQVSAYYRELTALANDLQREGRVNWHLAQQALQFIDFTLKLIARAKDGPRPYVPTARVAQGQPLQLLVDNCA